MPEPPKNNPQVLSVVYEETLEQSVKMWAVGTVELYIRYGGRGMAEVVGVTCGKKVRGQWMTLSQPC